MNHLLLKRSLMCKGIHDSSNQNQQKQSRTYNVQSILKVLFFLGLITFSANSFSQKKVKIGFVGNSITQAMHSEYEGYSDIADIFIKQYFGDVVDIQNFGNGGKTLVDAIDPAKGKPYDDSYRRQSTFTEALNFAPDIMFISLGTNDGRTDFWPATPGNRGFVNEFYGDYLSLIDTFATRNPNMHFIICYPPPIVGASWSWVDTELLKVRPEIHKVIAHTNSDSLDWYPLLKNYGSLFPDKIHPSLEGCALMGRFAFEKLVSTGFLDFAMSQSSLALNKPVAVSSSVGSNGGEKALDIDQNSYWEANFSGQQWISTDLVVPYETKVVRLVWGDNTSKSYQVQVSNNNADWTTIKTVTGDTSRIAPQMNLTGSGRYVRILLTNIDGTSIKLKEFEVYGNLYMAGVDFTKLGGLAYAQYTSVAKEGPDKAIDKLADTKFKVSNKHVWIDYSAPAAYSLNGYTVTSGSEGVNNPINWTLQGSLDDENWTTIDSVGFDTSVEFKLRYEKKYRQVSDTARYAFYRLNITSATNSVHIGGWELFGDYKSAIQPSYIVTLTSSISTLSNKLFGARNYWEGKTVQIVAGKGSGYRFTGWTGTAADVALLTDPLADSTTFIMPKRAISLKANYTRVTDLQSTESSVIKIFPNPVKNVLNISGLSSNAIVSIYNMAGVKLNVKTGTEIDVKDLKKGTYIVSIFTPQGVVNKIFLKD